MTFGFTELALALLIYGGVFLLAFFLLYLAVRRAVAGGIRDAAEPETNRAGGARRILGERYARGEISQEEHERMRWDVEGG